MNSMFEAVLREQYGLHLRHLQKSSIGTGSDTWFLRCAEGDYVLKFPTVNAIDHPEAEPELCAYLRRHGIPACLFLKNRQGSFLSRSADGRIYTVQQHFAGYTPEWNSLSEALLLESAELLGRIHHVLQAYPALPEGIGAAFFAAMTPQRALRSYRRTLAAAVQHGDAEIAAEVKWRIGLMERFPAWAFDLHRLTLRSTHGDYSVSQFLCENGHLTAVVDWTAACVHPVIWEIMRSFVYGAPCCADGQIDESLLQRYVEAYCRYGKLNPYDLENLQRLYDYQIAVCDYYGQYYASDASNRYIYLRQAQHATRLLKRIPELMR